MSRAEQADVDGSGAIDFEEFYGLWFSLTRPNEATLQEVKDILKKRQAAGLLLQHQLVTAGLTCCP